MKNFSNLAFSGLFVILVYACTNAPTETKQVMINPGDEIDSMIFTTTDKINWDISLAFSCNVESAQETDTSAKLACVAAPGSSVFFGNCMGIAYNTIEEAQEQWQFFESEVRFDGQLVNLTAFGYIDTDLEGDPENRYLRIWNLMVENISPGTHVVECKQQDNGVTHTGEFVFTVSDQPKTYQTLTVDAPHHLNPYTSEKAKINYLLYLPGEYGENPQKEWPLLIYLHGMDRVNKSVELLQADYPLSMLENQDYFSFIVVAPQGTGEYEFWATDGMISSIMNLLDEIQAILLVDESRIYLTGVSAGGNGAWSIGVRHPERFAALVSFMGYYGWPPSIPENICDLVDVPVWAFHGAKDELIPLDAEQKLVDALKACNGNVQFTVFPDKGHDLEGQEMYTSELYDWLLSNSRK